jgi:hypothetical protein
MIINLNFKLKFIYNIMKECKISQFFLKSSKIPSVFEKWTF